MKNGGVLSSLTMQSASPLIALVSGGLRVIARSFPAGNGPLGGQTQGSAVIDGTGATMWSDSTMSAKSVLVGNGVVYGIEQSGAANTGQLVAIEAPLNGLEQAAWPMLGHDLGRTSSASPTW